MPRRCSHLEEGARNDRGARQFPVRCHRRHAMQKRPLGHSPRSSAPLAYGCNGFGSSVDEKRSFELLDACVDAGGNLIYTADVYSAWEPGNAGGESETIISKCLKKSGKRDRVVISTKVAKGD